LCAAFLLSERVYVQCQKRVHGSRSSVYRFGAALCTSGHKGVQGQVGEEPKKQSVLHSRPTQEHNFFGSESPSLRNIMLTLYVALLLLVLEVWRRKLTCVVFLRFALPWTPRRSILKLSSLIMIPRIMYIVARCLGLLKTA
jgi:hypothetical protein